MSARLGSRVAATVTGWRGPGPSVPPDSEPRATLAFMVEVTLWTLVMVAGAVWFLAAVGF